MMVVIVYHDDYYYCYCFFLTPKDIVPGWCQNGRVWSSTVVAAAILDDDWIEKGQAFCAPIFDRSKIPSCKHAHSDGTSPLLMGKLSFLWPISSSQSVKLPEGRFATRGEHETWYQEFGSLTLRRLVAAAGERVVQFVSGQYGFV